MPSKSGDAALSEKQDQVLKHLARYRLSFQSLLAREFFGDCSKSCQNTLDQLKKKRLIQVFPRRLGRFALYQISESGAKETGCSAARSRPLGPESLPKHLAVLWFCYYGKTRRTRLESQELAHSKLFGFEVDGVHCFEPEGVRFEDGGTYPKIYQVFHLGAGAREDRLLSRAAKLTEFVRNHPSIQPFVDLRLYRIALLSNTQEGLKDFAAKLARTGILNTFPVESQLAPTPHTFERILKNETTKSSRRLHRPQPTP